MKELVFVFVISDQSQTPGLFQYLDDELGYHDYRKLLFESGTIGEGLNGEITQVRTFRNKLLHDPLFRLVSFHDKHPTTEVDRAYRTADRLVELHRESEGHKFIFGFMSEFYSP